MYSCSVTVQTGSCYSSLTAQSIHLREKSIAGPTERPKSFSFFGSQGSDQRFSMKMMFATYLRPEAACLNCYKYGQPIVVDVYVGVEKFVSRLYNAHDGV
jgi:hypothetical protein